MNTVVFTALDPPTAYPPIDLTNEIHKRKVREEWTALLENYVACDPVDLVFVFITPGYKGITSGQSPWTELHKENLMQRILDDIINGNKDKYKKIQVVGVRELVPTFASLEAQAKKNERPLKRVLLGRGTDLYYDSPKMVEAIIRIARGRHSAKSQSELIFRLDSDVEPNADAFNKLMNYYDRLPDAVKDGYYFYSGNYRVRSANGKDDLLNNFAVRCGHFAEHGWRDLLPSGGSDKQKAHDLAHKWLNSLERVGANVNEQVISGAGLCMSAKAISSLPPFANMSELIVWINDHLKRILHENVRNTGQRRPHLTESPDDLSFHLCTNANFKQNQHPDGIIVSAEKDDIAWHLDSYLPRLVRGCLMHGLIKEKEPGSDTSVFARIVETVMRWSYIPKLPSLHYAAEKHFEKILEEWQKADYSNTHLGEFACGELPKLGPSLIKQVLGDMKSYLDLLYLWPSFVSLIEEIPHGIADNEWLFRGLDINDKS